MVRVIPIDDPEDPRLADYRQVRERDLVGRDGAFIAEGQVVIEKLIRGGRHPLRSVLAAQKRVAGLAELFAGLPDEVPVYAAGQAVMDAVVGFPIHRGLLAVGARAEPTPGALLANLPDKALVVGWWASPITTTWVASSATPRLSGLTRCCWTTAAAIRCTARPSEYRLGRR